MAPEALSLYQRYWIPWLERRNVIYSIVVIGSGHIGSHEDQALLLGNDLRKDVVNQGPLG
jgi:hypothetical protein